jgi:hypothetical protein
LRRVLAAAAGWALAAVLVGAGPALAAEGDPPATPAPATGTAQVRVAHFSPDAPGVDVYLDGERALSNVTYNTTSEYQPVPAGSHDVTLRVAGSRPSADPVVDTEVDLTAGRAYTIAGLGPADGLEAGVFEDDLSSPPPGRAKVRVIHAAVGTGKLDVTATGGPALASDVRFMTAAPYMMVPPGRYGITVADGDDGTRLLAVPDVDVGGGVVYSIVVIGGAGQPLQILPLVDARGAEVLPAGALRTGGGGTAVSPGDPARAPWLVLGTSGGLLLTGFVVARVKRGRARTA